MLYHVSEEAGITRFEPRPAVNLDYPVVWAVHEDRLRNYLLPRDCPRVTFFAGPETTPQDIERFLGSSPAVVAIESLWELHDAVVGSTLSYSMIRMRNAGRRMR